MTPDQLDAVWTSVVRAIESRLDLPELKQFRSIIAELDADMRRDAAKEVAEKVQRILAGG